MVRTEGLQLTAHPQDAMTVEFISYQ